MDHPELRHWRSTVAVVAAVVAPVVVIAFSARDAPGWVTISAGMLAPVVPGIIVIYLRHQGDARQVELDQAYARLNAAEAELRGSQAYRHELSASLASISAAHRLLVGGRDLASSRHASVADMAERELDRLQRLSQGRLDPAAAEPVTPSPVATDDVIERLAVAHQMRGYPVEWRPTGAQVFADVDDLTTVLNILLDNAAKHGATVSSVDVRPEGDLVEIDVSDDGPGIPPDMGEEIFEWGVRGPQSSGSGIGLSVARDLVRRYDGFLTVRRWAGIGTTFVLCLPNAADRSADEGAHETAHVS